MRWWATLAWLGGAAGKPHRQGRRAGYFEEWRCRRTSRAIGSTAKLFDILLFLLS
jgi:hypothetical protein